MKTVSTALEGMVEIERRLVEDKRGYFSRVYCKKKFQEISPGFEAVQINNSFCVAKGTLRGLHFQRPPAAEIKIVFCVKGSVWDVGVDIRKDSVTYGRWHGAELNESNNKMLLIPKGFAHGYITLQPNSEIIYLVSEYYSPEMESSLRWDDSFHGIQWPIHPVIISEKDESVSPWSHDNAVKFI